MFDYRNNLKRILNSTEGDEKSLRNSLNAIKLVLGMTGESSEIAAASELDPKVIAQINTFLQGITKLIERPGNKDAKKTALGALHKLTFDQNIIANFGKQLGQLDQAIQSSEETSSAVYTVIRALKGADLINDNGEVVFEVNEGQIHDLNLKSGDIVEAIPVSDGLNEAEVLRVVGYRKLRSRDYDKIEDFKYGVVQGNPRNLSVSRNIHGERLTINHKPVIVALDSSYYQNGSVHLEDGSIVDLAWYTGDVRLKKDPASAVQIRWIYETEQPKRISKTKKEKSSRKNTQKLAQLDMNLHYQRVGIAVGDNQNEAILEGIVNRYNGIAIPIDAFEGKKKVIENQIKDLDIVILVTAFAAHDSTWNIREFASKYHVKFAVSSSKGYQAFERALYRAENGMPAYEGNQQLEYKMLKNN